MQELSLHVLDLAQNSVTAGATLIEITVEQHRPSDRLVIAITDNGCGMTPEQVKKATDPFFTSRTTRKVGLGLPFFEMLARQTSGSFELESHPGSGTGVRAVFDTSSVDCLPLGDMAETMTTLIGCNPGLDFVYTLRVDGKTFCADTRQFRQVLEGVPLSEPAVLNFIRDYIREHSESLYKDTPAI